MTVPGAAGCLLLWSLFYLDGKLDHECTKMSKFQGGTLVCFSSNQGSFHLSRVSRFHASISYPERELRCGLGSQLQKGAVGNLQTSDVNLAC